MKIRLAASALLSFALTSVIAQAQGTVLVANQKDHTLSLIDAATAKQIAAIPEDRITGHEVAASPDGRTAYLPIYGSGGVGGPGTDGTEMLVIDLPSRKVTGSVDFGHGVRPHLPVYDTHRNVVYVSNELDQAIVAIDPKTLKILYKIPTGAAESHMYTLSHDGKFAYTANVAPGSISVLDLNAHTTAAVLPIATHIQRISISNDDKLLFTSTSGNDAPRLAVVDTATRKVKQWIDLPGAGYGSASTKDGRYLVLALYHSSKVAIIDLAKMAIIQTIDVPAQPQEVIIRPDGKVAYISCNTDHKVVSIALEGAPTTWKVQNIIEAGNGADGLAWANTPKPTAAGGSH